MPGMNGQELGAAIQLERPGTRILYMSGYSRKIMDEHGVIESGAGFIEKSFSAETLCRSVRQMLDKDPSPTETRI